MENCKYQHKLFLNSVENAVRIRFERPPPNSAFELLHGQRPLSDEGCRRFNRSLKSTGQLWIDFSVVSLFAANVFTCRRKESDWLQ